MAYNKFKRFFFFIRCTSRRKFFKVSGKDVYRTWNVFALFNQLIKIEFDLSFP